MEARCKSRREGVSAALAGEGDADQDERQCQQGLQLDGIGEIQGTPEHAEQRHQVANH